MRTEYAISIDSGNTATSAAVFDLSSLECMCKKIFSTPDLKNRLYDAVKGFKELFEIQYVSVSCVSGEETLEMMLGIFKKFFSLESIYVVNYLPVEERLKGYKNPSQLGADRIAVILYAMEYGNNDNTVVVDAGTAVTIDGISKRQGYLGGYILPGISEQVKILSSLPGIRELHASNSKEEFLCIPGSTEEGIIAGVLFSVVGVVEKALECFRMYTGETGFTVIGTGGDSGYISKNTGLFDRVDCNAVLKGALIFSRFCK